MHKPTYSLPKSFILGAILVASAAAAKADVLVSFNPTGPSNNTSPLAAASVASGLTTTDLTRGSGTGGYDNAEGNSENFFGTYETTNSGATFSEAVSDGYYFGFTVTAGSSPVTITGFSLANDFHSYASSSTTSYYLEDSTTGFGSDSGDVLATVTDTAGTQEFAGPADPITVTTPIVLTAGQSEEVRLYFANPDIGDYTDFGIGVGGSTPVDPADSKPLELLGSVATPEPGTYALMGVGLALLIVTVRNRRAANI
jgi:hypothetical protein